MVSGKGIKKIQAAGITVKVGVLKEEGSELNKRFFTFMEKNRPYIILKWAETSDGFIAREDFSSKWISDEYSRTVVHKWRSEEDAIMVGTNTVICDNPRLNVRSWNGRDPLRVFIDGKLKVSSSAFLLDRTQNTLCYNFLKSEALENLEYVKIEAGDVIHSIVDDLHSRKIQSLLVEGGAKLLNQFIQLGLWDEVRLFKSGATFEKGIKSPEFKGDLMVRESIVSDELFIYKPSNSFLIHN